MARTHLLSALLLVATVSAFAAAGSNSRAPQQASPQPAAHPSAPAAPDAARPEIHVDEHCRILQDPATVAAGKKPHLRRDPVVCHLEGILNSEHLEKTIIGNERHETWVTVTEQEYVVQNITTAPVTYIVEQYVPTGWVVDSDPQPANTVGTISVFMVKTNPGQIVRLHVGMRHAKPLKTTIIKGVPPAPAPTSSSAPATPAPASTPPPAAAPAVN